MIILMHYCIEVGYLLAVKISYHKTQQDQADQVDQPLDHKIQWARLRVRMHLFPPSQE